MPPLTRVQRLRLCCNLVGNGYPVDKILPLLLSRLREKSSEDDLLLILSKILSGKKDREWFFYSRDAQDVLYLNGEPRGETRNETRRWKRRVWVWNAYCSERGRREAYPPLSEQIRFFDGDEEVEERIRSYLQKTKGWFSYGGVVLQQQ